MAASSGASWGAGSLLGPGSGAGSRPGPSSPVGSNPVSSNSVCVVRIRVGMSVNAMTTDEVTTTALITKLSVIACMKATLADTTTAWLTSMASFLHHDDLNCYHAAMIRTQVSLTEDQMRRLRLEARRRHISLAAVVRDAVDQVVPDEDQLRRDRIDALLDAAGSAASGTGTVAREHDEVLADNRW